MVPAFAISVPAELEASIRVLEERAILRELDTAIASALAARGLQHGWILPSELVRSYKRNPTYATDPYALAEEPLRSATFTVGSRLPEPLASQLRTMIALHEGARLVLLPIQLTYASAGGAPNGKRASLRIALVDPRFSEARWVGEVRSDTTSADPHVLTTAIAERVVDLIVSR